jgi:hypothetical protein
MRADAELDNWRSQWRAESTALPDLSAKVQRHSRFMRFMLACEVLITAAMGGTTTAWAWVSAEPDVIVLAAAVWLFIGVAWTFGLMNRRGCWAPAAQSTTAFLDLSIRRCRAGIAAARFAIVLFFGELLFCLIWVQRRRSLPAWDYFTSGPVLAVWAATAAFLVFITVSRRKKHAELAYLLELQRRQFVD